MSDGQFSVKPIRSGRAHDVIRDTGEFSTEVRLSRDSTDSFLHSPAVQREVHALTDQSIETAMRHDCTPLHKRTPDAAKALGRPIASATLVQEYLIGLIFLRVCGWIFLFFGSVFLLGAVITFFVVVLGQNGGVGHLGPVIALVGFGVFIGGTGAWFGIFRGRVVTEMCWFCPHGMIWLTDGTFDWYTWEQVPDVYCNLQGSRPAIGISFGRNVSWISFSDNLASRNLVERIEKLASAACMASVIEQFADGKTIRFGTWRLSRFSVRDSDATISWQEVDSVSCDHREIWIKQTGGGRITAPLDEIPFPSLFTALAFASFGYTRAQIS
jgi:hypothetical protein